LLSLTFRNGLVNCNLWSVVHPHLLRAGHTSMLNRRDDLCAIYSSSLELMITSFLLLMLNYAAKVVD
jgi:hypothetical protein